MNVNHPIIKKIQCYIVNTIIIARKSTPDKRFWKFYLHTLHKIRNNITQMNRGELIFIYIIDKFLNPIFVD